MMNIFKKTLASQGINSTIFYFQINSQKVFEYLYEQYNKSNYDIDSISLNQKCDLFQGSANNNCIPNDFGFYNHYINLYNNKLYDTTCGVGGYYVNEILNYLRDNVKIKIEFYNDVPLFLENYELTLDMFTF